jgi:hypothetical protein
MLTNLGVSHIEIGGNDAINKMDDCLRGGNLNAHKQFRAGPRSRKRERERKGTP